MLTIDDYLDVAKRRLDVNSDRKLAAALAIAPTSIFHMRRRHGLPADATMLRLADLAGLDRMQALLDLNRWRASTNDVRETYEQVARLVEIAKRNAAAILLSIALIGGAHVGNSRASEAPTYTLCARRHRDRPRRGQPRLAANAA